MYLLTTKFKIIPERTFALLVSCAMSLSAAYLLTAQGWGNQTQMQIQLEGDSFSNSTANLPSHTIASMYTKINGVIELLPFLRTQGSPYTGLLEATPTSEHTIWVEKFEFNHQFSDGRWCLSPNAAEAKSTFTGEFTATRPGSYTAEIYLNSSVVFSKKVAFHLEKSMASKILPIQASPTMIQPFELGRVKIPEPGPTKWTLKLPEDVHAGIKLSHIVLRPAPEGEPIRQLADGSVLLHARDSTTHGTKLQYEHLPHKNTVGYWIYESDYPSWQFELLRPGTYAVEVLQGCGTGHGGSEVNLKIHDTSLPFFVEETGHFQHFVPRIVGEVQFPRPDQYQLELIPVKKAGGAVMDVRQIRLIPLAKSP